MKVSFPHSESLHAEYRSAVPHTIRKLVDAHYAWADEETKRIVAERLIPLFDADADGNVVCTNPVAAREVSFPVLRSVVNGYRPPVQSTEERAAAQLAALGLSLGGNDFAPPGVDARDLREAATKIQDDEYARRREFNDRVHANLAGTELRGTKGGDQ